MNINNHTNHNCEKWKLSKSIVMPPTTFAIANNMFSTSNHHAQLKLQQCSYQWLCNCNCKYHNQKSSSTALQILAIAVIQKDKLKQGHCAPQEDSNLLQMRRCLFFLRSKNLEATRQKQRYKPKFEGLFWQDDHRGKKSSRNKNQHNKINVSQGWSSPWDKWNKQNFLNGIVHLRLLVGLLVLFLALGWFNN